MDDKGRVKGASLKDVPEAGSTIEGELLKIEEEISRPEAEIDSFFLRQRILNLKLEVSKEGNFD